MEYEDTQTQIEDLIEIQKEMNRIILSGQPKLDSIINNLSECHNTSIEANNQLDQAKSYWQRSKLGIVGAIVGGLIGLSVPIISPITIPIGIIGGMYMGTKIGS